VLPTAVALVPVLVCSLAVAGRVLPHGTTKHKTTDGVHALSNSAVW